VSKAVRLLTCRAVRGLKGLTAKVPPTDRTEPYETDRPATTTAPDQHRRIDADVPRPAGWSLKPGAPWKVARYSTRVQHVAPTTVFGRASGRTASAR
jgi:hypothetical protein